MLPAPLQLPAGLILLVSGLLACFAGYRLFRAVLTIYGFLLGALFASTLVPPNNVPAMLVAVGVGGVAGALILFTAYFAGVMLVGAALGALVLRSVWLQWQGAEPATLLLLLFAAVGAAAAVFAQRIVVILATAFGGAQTAVVGAAALLASRSWHKPGGGVWIGHLAPVGAGRGWPFVAWIVLGMLGTLVQLGSGKRRQPQKRR
jgi:hypothetical protein